MPEFLEALGPVARGLILTASAILWTVLLVRIVGLRAFSKMTAFDFVATIATGSLIAQAGTRADFNEYLQAMSAIAGVFLVQWSLARMRQRYRAVSNLLSNSPVLLMKDGKFLDQAMDATRVSRSNVLEKLRAANVSDLRSVQAVILETTGDISVLHGQSLDDELIDGVRRI